jgi:hypothetical protein
VSLYLSIFVDRDGLEWGDAWRVKIDENLAAGDFFIPILTPRYFMRAECRRELQLFVQEANDLGLRDLVLPILYVDIPTLSNGDPDDEIVKLIKQFQWEDWRSLRYAMRDSEEYRRAVNRLASRLADANKRVEDTEITPPPTAPSIVTPEDDESDDEDGTMDRLAEAESSMPSWVQIIETISSIITSITPLLTNTKKEIEESDHKGQGIGGRLRVFKKLAKELEAPANQIEQLGQDYTSELYKIDRGTSLLIAQIPEALKKDGEDKEAALLLKENISNLVNTTKGSLLSLNGFLDSMRPLEAMSKDLRRPLRKIRKGLTHVSEGGKIITAWEDLLDSNSEKKSKV